MALRGRHGARAARRIDLEHGHGEEVVGIIGVAIQVGHVFRVSPQVLVLLVDDCLQAQVDLRGADNANGTTPVVGGAPTLATSTLEQEVLVRRPGAGVGRVRLVGLFRLLRVEQSLVALLLDGF